jgi:hypothetical protein
MPNLLKNRRPTGPPNFGYVPDVAHANERAQLSASIYGATAIDDLPVDMDRGAYPYRAAALVLRENAKYVRKTTGGLLELLALSQGGHGSCVGWGEARKLLISLAAGIFLRGLDLTWPTDASGKPVSVSPSWCYGASREWNRGAWEGSNGSWAAKASQDLGILFERDYSAEGGPNLLQYSTGDCNAWESRGVPRAALAVAKLVRLEGYARVQTTEQLARVLQAGYGANMCDGLAPGRGARDEDGAIAQTGRWAHSETVICYDPVRKGKGNVRRLFGILNSHGTEKYTGPKGANTPDLPSGAYKVTESEMQRILDGRDTWVNFELDGLRPAASNYRRTLRKIVGGPYAFNL